MSEIVIHLLIIDDLEDNRKLLRLDIEDALPDIHIDEASNGLEGLEKIRTHAYTIVICDILMPGLDGFGVLQQARKLSNAEGMPFLFLSALRQAETVKRGLEIGAVDFLTKPYDIEELVYKVRNLASIKLLQNELRRSQQELMIANERLQRLNDDKNRIMQIVSHDLRSPLAGIKGLAKILQTEEEASNPETVREFSVMIGDTAEALSKLVNDLLNLTRIELGTQLTISPSLCNLQELVHSSLRTFEKLARHKNILVDFEAPPLPLMLSADEPKIVQMLNNLISNAIKFTREGGTITINLHSEIRSGKNVVVLTVADTGIGIPPEFMPHLFEKFGNHQRMGTQNEKGVGLGLPIAKCFIELHNGTIEIQSVVDQGTIIEIILPQDMSDISPEGD